MYVYIKHLNNRLSNLYYLYTYIRLISNLRQEKNEYLNTVLIAYVRFTIWVLWKTDKDSFSTIYNSH